MRIDRTFALVLLCFLLSGFAGLLFQTVWSRQFAFVFGTSDLAVATVLAAYMGGLALGAAAARRMVLRTTRPLLIYGFLELGIGLSALAVPAAIGAARALCVALFGGQPTLADSGAAPLSLFYLLSSFVILLVPTAFMGATLPLLTRFAVRNEAQVGSRVGVLYAVNTAGAVLGTVTTAFLLLPKLTLDQTVWIGVALNFAVFGLAIVAARDAEPPPAIETAAAASEAAPRRRLEVVLLLVFVAGVTSFSYEVLWTRLLGQIFGGTVYAFGTMLASFLTGIAIGSAVASRIARDRERAIRAFSITQLGVAFCAMGAFLAVDRLPELAIAMGAGSLGGPLKNAALAALVLLPSALFIGASFPLVVRVLARGDLDAGPVSARVYAWNTLGAIVGSVGAGFVWIPLLGYAGTLTATVLANLLVAAGAALLALPPRRILAGAVLAAALLVVVFRPSPPWKLLFTSALAVGTGEQSTDRVTFFAAGRSSTVLLLEDPVVGWLLLTNGLPEAGIVRPGNATMGAPVEWLGSLPVLARPDLRSLLVIGLGGGTTIERIAPGVESIDVIELEPEVVKANRKVADLRARDPLSDPRVHVTVNDARGALMLTEHRWDGIVSQPSHPWTAGASHLFTREFFGLVHDHLTSDGVFVQWMGVEFIDELLVRALLATLNDTFRHVRFYWTEHLQSALLVASDAPLELEDNVAGLLASDPDVFSHVGVHAPEDLAALLLLDSRGTRRLGRGAPVITDARNLFQFHAPRAMRAPITAARLLSLAAPLDPLPAAASRWNAPGLARRLVAANQQPRALALASELGDPAQRLAVLGLAERAVGNEKEARRQLRQAIQHDPGLREARFALTRRETPEGAPRYSVSAERAPDYPELEAVARGWGRAARGDWAGVAALEPQLAEVPAGDPVYVDALRLRTSWRIEFGDPAHGDEALALVDRLLPIGRHSADVVLRARAARLAGRSDIALETLAAILARLETDNPNNAVLLGSLELALAEIPEDANTSARRSQVADALLARQIEFRQAVPQYFE